MFEQAFYEQVDLPRLASKETPWSWSPSGERGKELAKNWGKVRGYAESLTAVKHESLKTYKEWTERLDESDCEELAKAWKLLADRNENAARTVAGMNGLSERLKAVQETLREMDTH